MPRLKQSVPLGTVSSGTLRTEDLLSAYESYCREFGGRRGKVLAREWAEMPAWDDLSAEEQEDAENLLEEMSNLLEDIAPDYATFGSLEGDGAEFGFWPDMGRLEEDARYSPSEVVKVDDISDVPARFVGYVMHVSDHGNVTLYWKSARKMREIWSVV